WQSQKNTDRTVQSVLLRAARELFDEDVSVGGSGRTDAGVHALAQAAHLKARKALPEKEIAFGLNDRLPFDVNVLDVSPAPPRFPCAPHPWERHLSLSVFPPPHGVRQEARLVGQGPPPVLRDETRGGELRRPPRFFIFLREPGRTGVDDRRRRGERPSRLGARDPLPRDRVSLSLEDGQATRWNARRGRPRKSLRGRRAAPSHNSLERSSHADCTAFS